MGRWKNIPRENRSCHLCNEEIYKMLTSFLIKHDIWKYRLVLQKDKSPLNFKSLGYVVSQESSDYTRIKLLLNQTLKDQFIQRCTSEMINSSRGQFYSNFKTDFSFKTA
jgi:hypothetical protein